MANTRAQLKAAYEAIRDAIVADIQAHPDQTRVTSYRIGNRSFSYATPSERVSLLEYIEGRITALSTASMFQLARFAEL
jgi:hypothetical protein